MKVLIVTTPIRPQPSNYPPFGSLALIKALRDKGLEEVEFFHIDANRPAYGDALAHIVAARPDVLGISAVVSTAYAYTKRLSQDVKAALPETLVVVGGNMAASAEILLRHTGTDLCVLGEGEVVFHNIVERARTTRKAREYLDIPGLIGLDGDRRLVNTGYEAALPGSRIFAHDWSDLEAACEIGLYFPHAFDQASGELRDIHFNHPKAFEPQRRTKRVATLPAAKGCVARCTFCHRWDKGIRHVPVEAFMANLERVIDRYDVGFVSIAAETFGADKRWLAEFCDRIKGYDVLWRAGGVRANSLDPQWIERLKECGCTGLIYGNETGSERILEIMEKKVDLADNYNAVRWTLEAGLRTVTQFVIGMPGETTSTVQETIEFCKFTNTLQREQAPFEVSINYAQALPGTPLYEFGRQNGMIGRSLEEEEAYLLRISDRDAHDENNTINFTDASRLEWLTWRPLINIEVNYEYVRKYGLDEYHRRIGEAFAEFRSEQAETGYFANPKRLVEQGYAAGATGSGGAVRLPTLLSLLRRGRFGMAQLCYPVVFYRLRALLPLMVLIKLVRECGAGAGLSALGEYLRAKITRRPARIVDYKSLRRIVDDMGPLPEDAAAMLPLRKGR